MKYETYSEYDSYRTFLAESAFITLWGSLGQWQEDLVLIGGLVPKYLCGDLTGQRDLPRPATLDVDLGIALGAAAGKARSLLLDDLTTQGFSPSPDKPSRYINTIGDFPVSVDLLVEDLPRTMGGAHISNATAAVLPGIVRALATARLVPITGTDLHGDEQHVTARICEAGPFLALKLRAFNYRQEPKDAFDILYTILHYDGGTDAAIAAFAEEVRLGNPACPDALQTLRKHFQDENAPGPVKASHFVLGAAAPGEPADTRFLRISIRQDMVDAAARLLNAATEHSNS